MFFDDKDDEKEEVVALPSTAGPPGVLRERFTVHANQPLPDLSTAMADAYVAEDKKEPGRKLFALVIRPGIPPRLSLMRGIKGLSHPGLMQLLEWGPMTWPSASRQCMTLIYERPLGQRVMKGLKDEVQKFADHEVSRRVIEPLLAVLKDFEMKSISHRNIRPTNLFYMDERHDRVALGDGATTAPACEQPAVFEPIPSAMCSPMARGAGSEADDMYALGATLAVLMIGRLPTAQMDDDTILRNKLEYGSYGTIVGENRLPMAMVELLRGLLCDDVKARWNLETLEMWVQGRRMTPLQAKPEKRAQRAFPFQGREYLTGKELASAFARHWDQALAVVMEGKLEIWLRRATEDKERAEAVAAQVRLAMTATSDKSAAEQVMLCRVLMMLDPNAPIRYRGYGAMPDGIGAALAVQMSKGAETKMLTEMIRRDVVKAYFEMDNGERDDPISEGSFRDIRNLMSQVGLGFGLERALYELNDSLPCQSKLVAEEYVMDIKDLMHGLNIYGTGKGDAAQWPCDRHVAAFIGARARSDVDRNLASINDPDKSKALMALLNMLAVFQYRLCPESLPGLASWVGKLATTLVESYHSREKRKEFEGTLPKLAKRGSVVEIFQLLDDASAKEKDFNDFSWAQAQYQAAEEAIRRIESQDEDIISGSDKVGKQFAAVTGIMVSMLTITISIIMRVW